MGDSFAARQVRYLLIVAILPIALVFGCIAIGQAIAKAIA